MNMTAILDRLKLGIELLQGVGLLTIVGLILLSIILRNFFGFGLIWVFEVTGFLMVWIVFLGAPRNLIAGDEIRVDTVVEMLGDRFRKPLWLFQKLVILLTSIVLVVYFVQHMARFGALASPTLHIPQTLFYGAIALGPLISILITLWHLFEHIKGRNSDERP